MSHQISAIRTELLHQFDAAFGYTGACTQHQREDAHYERGRKDGLGQALELLDTFLRADQTSPSGTNTPQRESRAEGSRVLRGRG